MARRPCAPGKGEALLFTKEGHPVPDRPEAEAAGAIDEARKRLGVEIAGGEVVLVHHDGGDQPPCLAQRAAADPLEMRSHQVTHRLAPWHATGRGEAAIVDEPPLRSGMADGGDAVLWLEHVT